MTKLDSLKPVPPLDPALFADHSLRIGMHEAAHCVAAYLFGREIHSARARERCGRTMVKKTDDVFAAAVGLVVGEAFERSIGLPPMGLSSSGSTRDLDAATKLLETQCSGAALDAACRVIEEAAIELASSERFHALAFALGPRITKERYLTASEIRETLEAADPERPVQRERHSSSGGWWIVTVPGLGGRVVYHGSSRPEAERVQRQRGGTLVGSIFG